MTLPDVAETPDQGHLCALAATPRRTTGASDVNFSRKTLSRALLVAVAPLFLAACGVNAIPTKEEAAKAQWAEVQNQYQRRADLIPNLVNTVKGFAAQEQAVLIGVTEARARATQVKVDADTLTDPAKFQEYSAAQDKLSGVLGRLMMIQERYPDLKSNQNFLALQSQLEGTENRISIARRDYNEAVRNYNLEFKTFPNSFWTVVHRNSKPMQLFAANEAAQAAPTVSFAPAGPAPQAPAPAQ
jgi:LemA protein